MTKTCELISNESIREMNSEMIVPITTLSINNLDDSSLQTSQTPSSYISIAPGNNKKIMINSDGTYAFKMKTQAVADTPLSAERSKCSTYLKVNGQYPNFSTSVSSGRINSVLGTTNAHIATLKAGDYVEFGTVLSSVYKEKDTIKNTNIPGYAGSLADGNPVITPATTVAVFKLPEFEEPSPALSLNMSPQSLILKSNSEITNLSKKSLISFDVDNNIGSDISIDGDGLIVANKDMTLHFGSNHACVCSESSKSSDYPDNHVQINVSLVKADGSEKILSQSVQSVGVDKQTNSLFTGLAVQMKAGEKIKYNGYSSKNTGILNISSPLQTNVKKVPHFLRCYRCNDDHICGHFDCESTKVNEPEVINIQNNMIISTNDALQINGDNSFSITDNKFAGNYLMQFQLNTKVDDVDGSGLSRLEDGKSGLAQAWFECSIDNGVTWKSCEQSNSSISVHKRGSQKTLETFAIDSFYDTNTRYRVVFSSHNPNNKLNTKLGSRKLIYETDSDIKSAGSFNIVKV